MKSNFITIFHIRFCTPRANLLGLSLRSYETNALIALNPTFNSNVLNYSAYIGTAANPTNQVNLTALLGTGIVVDWNIYSATISLELIGNLK